MSNPKVQKYEDTIKHCKTEITNLKKQHTSNKTKLNEQIKKRKVNEEKVQQLMKDVTAMKRQKINLVKKMKQQQDKMKSEEVIFYFFLYRYTYI